MREQIRAALTEAHPHDFAMIRSYIRWLLIRRRVTDRFYTPVHYAKPQHELWHWIGKGV